MGLILGTFFMGISVLAHNLKPTVLVPAAENYQTLLSLMGRYVYGGTTPLYYILQFSTFAILVLAANTAFADFPRVSSIIAGDGYLPRQLANRGDRLVFSNGIVVLSLVAAGLIIAFGGDTSALDPALRGRGVHRLHLVASRHGASTTGRCKEKGWRRNQIVNAVGSVATFIVLLVVVVSEVHDRRVDPGRADPDRRGGLQVDPSSLRPRHRCDPSPRGLPVETSPPHRHRARRQRPPRRTRRHHLRAIARP